MRTTRLRPSDYAVAQQGRFQNSHYNGLRPFALRPTCQCRARPPRGLDQFARLAGELIAAQLNGEPAAPARDLI